MYTSTEKSENFIRVDDIKTMIKNKLTAKGLSVPEALWSILLIPIKQNGENFVLKDDLDYYSLLMEMNAAITKADYERFNCDISQLSMLIKISENTALFIPITATNYQLPAFVRNLLYFSTHLKKGLIYKEAKVFSVMKVTIVTYDSQIERYIEQVLERKLILDRIGQTNFTNTTAYMGNKKKIAGFLIEAMFVTMPEKSIFLDLMCGSGAMSQAFAQIGETYASDAETFCRVLAKIQGSGYSEQQANSCFATIQTAYQKNLVELTTEYYDNIKEEAKLYTLDWSDTEQLLAYYNEYALKVPLYSSTNPNSQMIQNTIIQYKNNKSKFPYRLFTSYFANVFFGLNQCIQLDSLRYAVDQLTGADKEWALGALVVTAYQVASNHAGHFAQPKNVTRNNIKKILSVRQRSAFHEFSKRFMCLAKASAECPNPIQLLDGPWQNALAVFSSKNNNTSRIVVYLDAPYKRDEYSRYYHVLETLARYDYPSSENNGRIRSKKNGERFATEFFTKNISSIEDSFYAIITNVLSKKMVCAWSYSDNGIASIMKVIDRVKQDTLCSVKIFGIPYQHNSQRNAVKRIEVIEYCVIFLPR